MNEILICSHTEEPVISSKNMIFKDESPDDILPCYNISFLKQDSTVIVNEFHIKGS